MGVMFDACYRTRLQIFRRQPTVANYICERMLGELTEFCEDCMAFETYNSKVSVRDASEMFPEYVFVFDMYDDDEDIEEDYDTEYEDGWRMTYLSDSCIDDICALERAYERELVDYGLSVDIELD